jgi:putative transposase
MGCVDWPGNHVRIEGRGAISAEEMIKVIEGLALRKPRRSVATIQRQASAVALAQGWVGPSYRQVNEIVKAIPPALMTLAQEGGETYREEYELLYRREAARVQ